MPEGDQGLRVLVTDQHGRRVSAPGLAAWLRRVSPARARGAVNVALVSDARIRALNRTYRRKNYATDVLSFPAEKGPYPFFANGAPKKGYGPFSAVPLLGDIVIARGVATRQARAAGHDALTELKILALHGLLHLLGYDHDRDDGRMLRIERRLRRKGGLRESLIERARPSTSSGRARVRAHR